MGKGGGAVLLEEVVAHPGEAVAGREAGEQPGEVERRKGVQQREQAERGADEMQAAAGAVRMLRQVERIEIREAGKSHVVFLPREIMTHGGDERAVWSRPR